MFDVWEGYKTLCDHISIFCGSWKLFLFRNVPQNYCEYERKPSMQLRMRNHTNWMQNVQKIEITITQFVPEHQLDKSTFILIFTRSKFIQIQMQMECLTNDEVTNWIKASAKKMFCQRQHQVKVFFYYFLQKSYKNTQYFYEVVLERWWRGGKQTIQSTWPKKDSSLKFMCIFLTLIPFFSLTLIHIICRLSFAWKCVYPTYIIMLKKLNGCSEPRVRARLKEIK